MSYESAYVEELKKLAKDNPNIVVVKDRIADNDIQVYMNAADVVVFPFRQVSNSAAVILAKSFYKPTICMNLGNISDYANPDTDILVDNESELEKALFNVQDRRFSKDRKAYIKNIPSVEAVAVMYKKLYLEELRK